ncbi:hypothetical protein RDI58_029112 [Solanum bulbocastanum]|uniref:Uncharacterized protein n=1 Tax=Solanum bulbocastanum TaxID=147425 RepID=A0AAN8SWV9_SOLBU
MEVSISRSSSPTHSKWRKVVYGGMQPSFGDNHTDESFLEEMIMNANVVKRDLLKVVLDAVSISQYLCIVALVVLVHKLEFYMGTNSFPSHTPSLHNYSGSTVNAPGALDNPTLASNISLNASIVASLLISSRLPSRLHVFAIVLFSLQVFLFAPLVTYCVKKRSFKLHICFSLQLLVLTLVFTYQLHKLLFTVL